LERPFSDVGETPWSRGEGWNGPPLYGGVRVEALRTRKPFGRYELTPFSLLYQVWRGREQARLNAILVFKASRDDLHFDVGRNGRSSMSIGNFGGHPMQHCDYLGTVRWLVRNGNAYYVSSSTITNTSTGRVLTARELEKEQWAKYSPTLSFETVALTFDTPSSALTKLNAFGIVAGNSAYTDERIWLMFEVFRVDAELGGAKRGQMAAEAPVPAIAPVEAAPGGATGKATAPDKKD
jgi:hypothetical protein